MKFQFLYILFLFTLLTSCKDDENQRLTENVKDAKKRELIFSNIENGWNFNAQPANETSRQLTATWSEWNLFLKELGQKPKSSIGAFQKKAKTLSGKAMELNNNIPADYNKPEIKSRISVLTTKINSLNLFIHLDNIPDQKIILLVSQINTELASLQSQMNEIVRKKQIPKEVGESDLIKMLDTSRAIPNIKPNKILP